jgi:hypothetical protein
MESDLKTSYKYLKERLSTIENILCEQEVEEEFIPIDEYTIKPLNIIRTNEEKLKELELTNYANEKIIFDACGKVFQTSKFTVTDCLLENTLKDKLTNEVIYTNIPKTYFKHILAILRYFNKYEFNGEKMIINLNKNDIIENLKNAISEIFTDMNKINNYVKYVMLA